MDLNQGHLKHRSTPRIVGSICVENTHIEISETAHRAVTQSNLWTHLIVRFGVVVQRQDVLQEDIELSRHVLEEHPVVVALLDLAHLLLEEDTRELPGVSSALM